MFRRLPAGSLEDVRADRQPGSGSGGAHRAVAIAAAISRIGCNTLVTDETAAAALLDLKAG